MRKRHFILSAVLFSSFNFSFAQITFQKTYGGINSDRGFSVQQTTDNGYIITGSANYVSSGTSDVYLIKTNVYGDTLWTRIFGGGADDRGESVKQTSDGGYIIAGATGSFGAGLADVYLIRTDTNGDTLWTKTFGGIASDEGYDIQQTTDNGFIISGRTSSFGAGQGDVYLIKTDANGNALWSKSFGGIELEWGGQSVKQTLDGGYIIAGSTYSFGAGYDDIYLIRTDMNGDVLWTKTYGGTESDYGISVQQTTDGGFIVVGETYSFFASITNVYLIKTDTNGDILWSKTFIWGSQFYKGNSVQQTSDGGYIMSGTHGGGSTNYGINLIKTNANGDSLWTRKFGITGGSEGNSVQQTNDGGYIITGYIAFVPTNTDVFLIKTDSLGNSGCNQIGTFTQVSVPSTQVSSATTTVTSPITIQSNAATTVGSSNSSIATFCINVGINEPADENAFLITPNPSAGDFIISFERTIVNGNVEILSLPGKTIYKENIFSDSQKEINLKNISRGFYFVKVYDGEKYGIQKLVIEQN